MTYTTSNMDESHVPRVNLPDTIPRRPVVPGANSWAQQQQQEQERNSTSNSTNATRPTNRDKYEHKPMPPPPPSEDGGSRGPSPLQPKAYIQPAIPLFPPSSHMTNQKLRAVTDPVPPKPLFAGRNISVSQLRKKYSQSKGNGGKDEPSNHGLIDDDQASPGFTVTSEKAAQILGLPQGSDSSRNTPRASAGTMSAPDPFQTTHPESQEQTAIPARQVQSSPVPTRSAPVPTRRYLKENAGTFTEASSVPKRHADQGNQGEMDTSIKAPESKPNNGFLHPTRVGTHSNVGEVEVVEGSGMHRVESFRGVIEDAPTSSSSNGQIYTNSYTTSYQPSNEQKYTNPYATSSQPSSGRGQGPPQDMMPPNVYSPSNYGGVWENDPAVGHTLPPFTPMPKNRSSAADTASHYNSPLAQPHFDPVQNTARTPQHSTNRFSNCQPPLPSANSWASNNSYGNSFTSPSALPSALLPPGWPHYHNTNSVPSPPQNQHDFERAGSLSAALAQMDLTLHHHIDSTFGSISRLITNKHDHMMDQTIRRLENIEEALKKGFKDLKSEIRDIRKHIGNLQTDVKDDRKQRDAEMEMVKGLDAKLQALEKHIDEYACKCEHSPPEQSASEPESDRAGRSEGPSRASHRRTESAHPTVGQGESRQQYQIGASRTSNSTRISGTSNRRERSNTINSQQPSGRMSDERNNRREYFAELGATRGPVPDLRDHPAFADRQQIQEQTYAHSRHGMPIMSGALPYENPSLSDGRWYQQAYGQHK